MNENNDTIGNEDSVFQDMFNPDLWVVNDLVEEMNNLNLNEEVEEQEAEEQEAEEQEAEEQDAEEQEVEEQDAEEQETDEEQLFYDDDEIIQPNDYVIAERQFPIVFEEENVASYELESENGDIVYPIDSSGNLVDNLSSGEDSQEAVEHTNNIEIDINEIIVEDCCVCYKECTPINIVNTPCGHIYCKECFFRWIRVRPTCPMCRCNFTSLSNMSRDELNTDIASITQLYRRTIIENNRLLKNNESILKTNVKRKIKNHNLKLENDTLIKRLVRVREQIDFTKGYNTAFKFKMKKELTDYLNIDNEKNIHILKMNSLEHMNSPFYKGFKEGLVDVEYYISNDKFDIRDFHALKNNNVENKWKKASENVLNTRKKFQI